MNILKIALLPLVFASSLAAAMSDVIVHIVLVDGRVVTKADVKPTSHILKKKFRDLEVATIPVFTKPIEPATISKDEIRRQVRARLDELLGGNMRYARTIVITADVSLAADRTVIPFLGTFGDDGPDHELAEVFAPFLHRTSFNARVLVLGGPSLPTDQSDAERRARGLLKGLGVADGSYFGLDKPAITTNPRLGPARVKRLFAGSLLTSLAAGLGAVYIGEAEGAVQIAMAVGAGVFGFGTAAWNTALRVQGLLQSARGTVNAGRVVQLRNAEVLFSKILRVRFDQKDVFICDAILTPPHRPWWIRLIQI